jgi:hypothetical protein
VDTGVVGVRGAVERRLDGEAERATRRSKGGGGAGGLVGGED